MCAEVERNSTLREFTNSRDSWSTQLGARRAVTNRFWPLKKNQIFLFFLVAAFLKGEKVGQPPPPVVATCSRPPAPRVGGGEGDWVAEHHRCAELLARRLELCEYCERKKATLQTDRGGGDRVGWAWDGPDPARRFALFAQCPAPRQGAPIVRILRIKRKLLLNATGRKSCRPTRPGRRNQVKPYRPHRVHPLQPRSFVHCVRLGQSAATHSRSSRTLQR